MRRRAIASVLMIAVMLTVTACSSSSAPKTDGITMPASSQHFEGEDYKSVVAALEKAGFTQVQATGLEDLITGWLHTDGEVKAVKVDGETDFRSGAVYAAEVPIVVSYHSYPTAKEQPAEPDTSDSTPNAVPDTKPDGRSLAERTRARFLSAWNVDSETALIDLDGYDTSIPTYAINRWEEVAGDYVGVHVQEDITEQEAHLIGRQILGLTCKNSQGSNGDTAVDIKGIVVRGTNGLDVNVYKSEMPLCAL